ncbi:MAG TPA: glucoamylase family protein [Gemmatimonadota bacterium]|nr:glucoamylase family protein [Gemmatimonadota bacterium]
MPAGDNLLLDLQKETFRYFAHQTNPSNGLVADSSRPDSPVSIAAVGLGLAAYPVAVERGLLRRAEALDRALAAARFFHAAPQGREPDATGWKGFYYHFLDRESGRRVWRSELSTVDSAFLIAGMLMCGAYFDGPAGGESELREKADEIYRRVDWKWALGRSRTLSHGWTPERGFLRYRWCGYDEALLLYTLALGSPTHPIPPDSYRAWCETYAWERHYDIEYLYAGPLFIHQLSHVWIDFRRIRDPYMRGRGIDYFENSRRATLVHRLYAIDNPHGFKGYGPDAWGLTSCEGPGPAVHRVDGRRRRFWGYRNRGAPRGPDDGTLAPWAVVASLPFAPDIVMPAIERMNRPRLRGEDEYGFCATYNPTFPGAEAGRGWVSRWHYGLNQGPIVTMIENHLTELPWSLMRGCGYLVEGLRRVGFEGGWLGEARGR